MPVTVEKRVPASEVKPKDEIRFHGKHFSELVEDVDPKRLYTTITTDYGSTRISLNDMVHVYREELTEEEKVAQDRQRQNDWIRNEIEQTPELMARFRNRLFDDLGMKDASWHGNIWASYAMTQQLNTLWTLVADVSFNRKVDYVDAVKIVRESVRKDILRNIRFSSNSTSPISNLAKGLELEAKAQWLNELEWHVT